MFAVFDLPGSTVRFAPRRRRAQPFMSDFERRRGRLPECSPSTVPARSGRCASGDRGTDPAAENFARREKRHSRHEPCGVPAHGLTARVRHHAACIVALVVIGSGSGRPGGGEFCAWAPSAAPMPCDTPQLVCQGGIQSQERRPRCERHAVSVAFLRFFSRRAATLRSTPICRL
jgi:hypothetical protein